MTSTDFGLLKLLKNGVCFEILISETRLSGFHLLLHIGLVVLEIPFDVCSLVPMVSLILESGFYTKPCMQAF